MKDAMLAITKQHKTAGLKGGKYAIPAAATGGGGEGPPDPGPYPASVVLEGQVKSDGSILTFEVRIAGTPVWSRVFEMDTLNDGVMTEGAIALTPPNVSEDPEDPHCSAEGCAAALAAAMGDFPGTVEYPSGNETLFGLYTTATGSNVEIEWHNIGDGITTGGDGP